MFLVRNGIVIVHSTCMTIIQFMLSISVIHTINSFGSLFVFVWDYLLNGISINWKQFFGIVLGTIGVLLAGNGDQIYSLIDDNFINESSFLNFYKLTTN